MRIIAAIILIASGVLIIAANSLIAHEHITRRDALGYGVVILIPWTAVWIGQWRSR